MKRLDSINLGDVLRNARENCDMTQDEVAKMLGLKRDVILRIENGKRNVSIWSRLFCRIFV